MALTSASLKARLIAELGTATDPVMQGDILEKIAKAIVDEIKENGVVTMPASGLVAPNGPVTGAATGTIS